MRAVGVREFGGRMEMFDLPNPRDSGQDEMVIEVAAALPVRALTATPLPLHAPGRRAARGSPCVAGPRQLERVHQ